MPFLYRGIYTTFCVGSYSCTALWTLLIFTEKFLPGFEPGTSAVPSRYATNWAILAWITYTNQLISQGWKHQFLFLFSDNRQMPLFPWLYPWKLSNTELVICRSWIFWSQERSSVFGDQDRFFTPPSRLECRRRNKTDECSLNSRFVSKN